MGPILSTGIHGGTGLVITRDSLDYTEEFSMASGFLYARPIAFHRPAKTLVDGGR